MKITRYAVKNNELAPCIKFFWELKADGQEIYQKLLPTENIDVLINYGDKIIYTMGETCIVAPEIHINGLRNQYSVIHQTGNIHIIGISFHPFGLYPFVHKHMARIKDCIMDLHDISEDLAEQLKGLSGQQDTIVHLENVLLANLDADSQYLEMTERISRFLMSERKVTLKYFCSEQNINIKTFERHCKRLTAYTPTILRRIHRFQSASNEIVHKQPANLADVAYKNEYADQAHLNREFRAFSGEAPRTFTEQKLSVKENAEYKYR